jgi:DNA invertase Pin-like site-specific DNA recombinase
MIYGYCRISTDKQNIERQVRNILKAFPEAIIISEIFTGTKTQDRKIFTQLLKNVKSGDTVVFDSVSRMSRNAESGFQIYQELYEKDIELVFLKEPHLNTAAYKRVSSDLVDVLALAKFQVFQAFEQAEKEVSYIQQSTKEGIEIAKMKGKKIGRSLGANVITTKSIEAKKQILALSKDFYGKLNDVCCIRTIGIARNTYYKYKAELKKENDT